MKIGYAQKEITPKIGTKLAGYGVEQISNEVHDPLMVRVMVIRTQPRATILVQTDLIGISRDIVDQFAKKLKARRNQIMICCTHTHSGPVGTVGLEGLESIFGNENPEYIEYWLEQATRCYMEAQLKSSETEVAYAQVLASNIGSDRHDGTQGDDHLSVWVFKQANGSKYLLYNFACHPTIMNGVNLKITADLPYGVIEELENDYKGIMFINGSAGDISTRFTRQDSSFDEVKRKGKLLAGYIREATTDLTFEPVTNVEIKQEEFPVKIKAAPDINEVKSKLQAQELLVEKAKKANADETEIRVLYSVVEGYKALIDSIPALNQFQGITLTVTFMKINDNILIGIPVELFSKLSDKYHEIDKRLHFVSYCNGYYMYLTNEIAFEKNYYESGTSIFEKGEGENLMNSIYTKFKELNW